MSATVRAGVLVVAISCIVVGTATASTGPGHAGFQQDSDSRDLLEHLDIPARDGPDTYAGNHTWFRLWSGDLDDPNATAFDRPGELGFEVSMAASTDSAFYRPPDAVGRWNSRNHRNYTSGDVDTSVYPGGATLHDRGLVRDAFVEIYAVSPSTVLETGNGSTRYVASSGRLHAISDFRTATGEEHRTGPRRVRISEAEGTVSALELFADDESHARDSGPTAVLAYDGLSGAVELRIEARIDATLDVEIRECESWEDRSASCTGNWNVTNTERQRSFRIATTRTVVVNDMDSIPRRRVSDRGGRVSNDSRGADRTPDPERRIGEIHPRESEPTGGLAVEPTAEWSSIAVGPSGRVSSHLRFYSRSPTGWETMVRAGSDGTTRTESRVRPLEVHAYPSPDGVEVHSGEGGEEPIEVARSVGVEQRGPELDDAIDLVAADPYDSINGIAITSTVYDPEVFESVTVHGIVAGQRWNVSTHLVDVVRSSEVDLHVEESNATHVTVTAEVTDSQSGGPITNGSVELAGDRYPVNNGTVTRTVANPPEVLRARYVPAYWLNGSDPYRTASDAVKVSASGLVFGDLIRFGLWTCLAFLPLSLAILGVDYITGGELLGIRGSTDE